jgi:TonB-linked SusC/RagA family outer membrane protein
MMLLIFLAGTTFASAENLQQGKKVVTGKVIDADTKESLPAASVWIKETTTGVITDADGLYRITVDRPGAVLVFSFIGYENVEMLAGDRTTIDVTLQPSSSSLEEVVVVGYGTQKKESVVGAIASVKPTDLVMPTAFVSNVLAGQISGVQVIQRSGEPGTHAEFWIRGVSTMKSQNSPLVLVDGIERSIDHVDVEDIESISVLKDASATAIYGVRGANGVILVTTRKGSEGSPKITVNANAGMVSPTRLPEFVNSSEYAGYYNEVFGYNNNGQKFYSDEVIAKYRDHSDPELYPDVNWIDRIFKDFSWSERISANVSGGGTIARYYVSASYYSESSIYKEDNLKKYDSSTRFDKFNFRTNVDINLSKTTELHVNLSNCYETKTAPGGDFIWRNAFEIAPNAMPMKLNDGTLVSVTGLPIGYDNPYNSLTQYGYANSYWNTSQAVVGVSEDMKYITPGLMFNAKFSWDAHNGAILRYIGSPNTYEIQGRDENGLLMLNQVQPGSNTLTYDRALDSRTSTRTTYLETSLAYSRLFAGKHRVSGTFLYNQRSHHGLNAVDKNNSVPYRNHGIAGRLIYAFEDKYLTDFNFGYNGSENFSPSKRYGFFPSIALGWRISEENFFQPLTNVISGLKIRGSYGLVGNDQLGGNRRFIYNPTYNTGGGSYIYGDGSNPGWIRAGDVANDQVSWETCKKFNFGLDIELFNSLKIEADYYTERRDGIFLQRDDISFAAGLNVMPWSNMGIVDNKGFDLHVENFKSINKDLSVSLRGNFTYNHNIMVKNAQPAYNYEYRNREGHRVGQTFGLIADGLFSSQEEIDNSPTQFGVVRVGDIKYRDLNGDGTISLFDETAIGYSWLPEITYSGGFSIQYKGIDFSVLFQGVGRVSSMLGGRAMQPFRSGSRTTSAFFKDVYDKAWRLDNPNPNAEYPRAYDGSFPNNEQASTYWLRDAGYCRLKDLTLGYTLPKTMSARLHLKNLRVYLSGVNLLTFSKIKMFDPEVVDNAGLAQGAGYPPNRIVSFGVNISF